MTNREDDSIMVGPCRCCLGPWHSRILWFGCPCKPLTVREHMFCPGPSSSMTTVVQHGQWRMFILIFANRKSFFCAIDDAIWAMGWRPRTDWRRRDASFYCKTLKLKTVYWFLKRSFDRNIEKSRKHCNNIGETKEQENHLGQIIARQKNRRVSRLMDELKTRRGIL